MSWKLWLDDERPAPVGYLHAKSTDQALAMVVELGAPEFMSLDHDLGGNDTAMVFVRKLSEILNAPPKYQVHSANPVGVQNLLSLLSSWERSI
jgi:hypothetical protein